MRAIYSQRFAGWLMMRGFRLMEMVLDEATEKNVFYFKLNNKLCEAMHEYSSQWKTAKN